MDPIAVQTITETKPAPSAEALLLTGLSVAGINHKTAPVAIRECSSLPVGYGDKLAAAKTALNVAGLVAVSTCNRTEFYWTADCEIAPRDLFREIARTPDHELENLEPCIYQYSGPDVVEHLFQVVCGLDSLVVGETQILGQLKRAYERSLEHGVTDSGLNLLFQRAFETAKKVHTETSLASDQASVPAVALKLTKAFFDDLEQTSVLVVGTGEIARLTVDILHQKGAQKISFITRTAERAKVWEERYPGAQVRTLDHLADMIASADIVIACTHSKDPVITPEVAAAAQKHRAKRGQPLLILDLGIPRNVAPAIAKAMPVYLYNIDDLQKAVEENRVRVEAETKKAGKIIRDAIETFNRACAEATARDTIREVRDLAQQIAGRELDRTLSKLSHLNPKEQEEVAALVHRILGKILHPPTENLRIASRNGHAREAVAWARTLFGLDREKEKCKG